MDAVEPRRSVAPKETLTQALHRLANQAVARGIEIYTYDLGRGIEYFATSTSRPGTLHRVTLISCDCAGFISHQRCQHYARLLLAIGELPPLDPVEQLARTERQREITMARAEVARLNRNPKSTSDYHALQNARARLWELVALDVMTPAVPAQIAA